MKDKTFIDTNILIHAHNESEKEKESRAREIIKSIFEGKQKAHLSNQILGELFLGITKRIPEPIPKQEARDIVESIIRSQNWIKLNYTEKQISLAMKLNIKYNLHFWDALIAATMLQNNIYTIYTENDKDFKKIPGLKVINPLKK